MKRTLYDIAIVGSGIAGSMTLCELAERVKDTRAANRKLRIAVIEKEGEFWNGIPYGRRSTIGTLTFQKLQDFLDEPDRTAFIEWLSANEPAWIDVFRKTGGLGAAKWISDNQPYMKRGQWGELYLPRFLFGNYVSSRAARALDELSRDDLASVTLLHGEATEIARGQDGFHTVTLEDSCGAKSALQCTRVVVAIGSPPQKSIQSSVNTTEQCHTYINDIYAPSEDVTVKCIYHALASLPEKKMANILILGSNASSLEVLYLFNYRPEMRNLINSVVVISRTGSLPYKICEETLTFELTRLLSLNHRNGTLSAGDLIAAITSDIRRAHESGINIADLQHSIGALVSQLTGTMDIVEHEKFVCQHGVTFSKMMRRAGRDTRNAADELSNLGVLTMVKGEFRRLDPSPFGKDFVSATYADSGCQGDITHPTPFSIVINCGGFEELDVCSSRLINNLIAGELCKVNSTNRGLLVNDRLEATDNLYVIGPLVGGNFNDKIRFWHVESASRIAGLSRLLAASLYRSLYPPNGSTHSDANNVTGILPAETSSLH
jgi:uncharacterized NAD(P)/FAD-binding protein YdhS